MLESGIAKAVRLAESQSALARLLKCTPQCVQRWAKQGFVAAKRCKDVEAALGGRVTRAELNPSTFGPAALA
jgi:DNA-binding transcriptional regulator YdaS (Cro superfamily)